MAHTTVYCDPIQAAAVNRAAAADAERFAAWQRDALEARAVDSEVLTIGPFRVALAKDKAAPGSSWVTMVEGSASEDETMKAVPKLKAAFKKHKSPLEIEFNDAAFPNVGAWLEAAGLKLAEKNPLMACRPEMFKPSINAEVHLTQLRATAIAAELEAFQQIRWTNGGDIKGNVPAVDTLRVALGAPSSVFLLAWLDWQAAGTGVSHALNGAAEIVGIVTDKHHRRRGVASTVTSELVRRHFEGGGDFVFLDAAGDEAAAVYEKLGFSRFGANLVYQ
jgi:ribosomal protein S18 acetylase RimI-like enzyme